MIFSDMINDECLHILDGLTVPEPEATEDPIPVETEEETVPETEAETEPEETEDEPAEESNEDSPISVETAPMAEENAVVETAETAPDETSAETVPETVEETEAPTAPETTAETEAPTAPETTEPEITAATEETLPEAAVEEGAAYNRSSSAAISYPNAEKEDNSLLHIFSSLGKEEPTLEEQIMPEKLRTQVVYEDIFEGVDLKYLLYSYNVKETIVVKQPLAGYAFTFQLGLDGLTPELREDGSIFLTDDSGVASYFIPAPYMVDANRMDSDAVSYGLSQDKDGNWLLTVEADREWIEDPDRAFPVEIDPTLIKYAGNADSEISATYVEEGSPNTVHGGQQDLYFGYSSYGNGQGGVLAKQQIYMNFNSLPDLPQGSVVVDASLMLWQFSYSHVSCDKTTIGLYEVSGDKSSDYSSYRNWIYYMTWNNRPNYDSNNMIDYTTASASADDLYLSWGMTELVNKWYRTGSSKRAITLVAANASSFNNSYCASIAFSAYSGSHPPILAVSYRNNTGLEPYYTYQTMDAGNAGTVYISDFSSQVTVTKDLFSYASSANPFTAQLVFNSAYFAKKADLQYDLGADLGMAMHFGSGCTYNFVQYV